MTNRHHSTINVQTACIWEVLARKVGNVHPQAAFRNTNHLDFLLSAAAIGPSFADPARVRPGELILHAVQATIATVGQNTNLGIILLLAPLMLANSKPELQRLLESLTVEDAEQVYEAIRTASPGGLGDAPEQDVRDQPTLTLREAMALAADRDLIARQYVNGFADVHEVGVPALMEGFERFQCVEAAIIHCQLSWLAAFPDSLIARKVGIEKAQEIQHIAAKIAQIGGIATVEGRAAGVALDRLLRSEGNRLNPGTTADLVTACLFVARQDRNLEIAAPFFWTVSDWL